LNSPPARPSVPHVVIIGCGFGGLAAARILGRATVRVTVIDRTNHHLFQPLLYQVATAGLAAPAIAAPIRHILRRQANTTVLLGDVRAIDADARTVRVDDLGDLAYDALIVAAGATHSYFGHDDWMPYAPGLKTLDDALDIRNRVLLAYERAERESDAMRRDACLTFVIVGAGPTGVELAGTLTEIARHTLREEFRNFDSHRARVILVEAGDRVLSAFPPDLSRKARVQLERLGVEVRVNTTVTGIDAHGVSFGAERIAAATVLWAAGVAAAPLAQSLNVPLDRSGRVLVNDDLSIPGHPDVFVAGDLASVRAGDRQVPGVAQAAKQMGQAAARNVLCRLRGTPTAAFAYRDYATLATIGRESAVAVFGRVKLSGAVAWLAWLFLHVFFLIGFRNRLMVLTDWAWAYVTFHRNARIVSPRAETDRTPGRT
jgi:NADH dehydrogenase